MSDREKVVERLGKVSYYFKSLRAVGWQGDADIYREHQESVNMAIALLKEQEPVRPQTVLHTGNREEPTIQALICGNCHKIMGGIVFNYCPWCGREVKWDE